MEQRREEEGNSPWHGDSQDGIGNTTEAVCFEDAIIEKDDRPLDAPDRDDVEELGYEQDIQHSESVSKARSPRRPERAKYGGR